MKVITAKVPPIKTGDCFQNITFQGEADQRGVFFGQVIVRRVILGDIKRLNFDEIVALHAQILSGLKTSANGDLRSMEVAVASVTKTGTSWVAQNKIRKKIPSAPPLEVTCQPKHITSIPSAPPLELIDPPSYEEAMKWQKPKPARPPMPSKAVMDAYREARQIN